MTRPTSTSADAALAAWIVIATLLLATVAATIAAFSWAGHQPWPVPHYAAWLPAPQSTERVVRLVHTELP